MNLLETGLLKLLPTTITCLFLFYLGCKACDMLLGILKTLKNQNYKSRKMRDGIVRWVAELVAIVFVIGIDLVLGLNFLLCGFTLGLFIYKEAGSICENLNECGVTLPNVVIEKLEAFNPDKEGKKDKEKQGQLK